MFNRFDCFLKLKASDVKKHFIRFSTENQFSFIRNDSHPDTTFVRFHRSDKGPDIRFRIVDFDCRQILHAIVPTDGPKSAHVRHKSDATPSDVHRRDVTPPENYCRTFLESNHLKWIDFHNLTEVLDLKGKCSIPSSFQFI